MPTITLRPTTIEFSLNRQRYEALVSELGSAGYQVRLDDPTGRDEIRSVPVR